MADYDLTQTGQEVQDILDGAAMQTDLTAETQRAELAEQSLQGGIDAEETRAKAAEKQNADDIDVIESKIPAGASDQNQLADKDFVNNSIATATATYRGAYNLVNDLSLTVGATHEQIATALAGAISTADNNDYCFVQIPISDAAPTQIASIERYKFNGTVWAYEYTLNNSGFTAAQWAALNSGITSGLVAKLLALPTNEALTLALAGKQDVLTFDSVPVDGSNNPVKSGGVYSAIGDEETRAKAAEKANADDIDDIEALIPAAASDENQLADKEYVNSSISTATATYRGSFNEVNDLSLNTDATHEQIATALAGAISTADNNDYCFVQIPTSDAAPTQIASIERYKFNGTAWAYEYTLNNSGFTAAQWAALNSGITSGLVAKLSALPTNDALTLALAGKQDVLTFDNEPTSGSNNPVKSGGVYDAIDVEATTRAAAIAAIVALIPEAASALNQLADKSFVNSSISTATAVFKGTYNVVVDLELSYNATQEQIATMLASKIISADNNDYCFVQIPTSDAAPLQIARTDRYKFNGTAWAYEYTLNNSGFTSAQWAAINSGITSLLKDKLIDLPTATELTALLAAKQNQLTFDTTPTTGSTNPVTSGGIKSAIDAEKTRAEAAEGDRYTKSETYNKTEINGMVSTPHQNYVTVATYASLPASGSADTIYRVSSYDGANNQVDDTVYSEYAWDGTQYVFLRVNSQIEEVFDITVYNNNTKYADLSAALGVDGANIPANLRRGGMSVKFVQSSDNKYVQYRFLLSGSFTDSQFANADNWQGGMEYISYDMLTSNVYFNTHVREIYITGSFTKLRIQFTGTWLQIFNNYTLVLQFAAASGSMVNPSYAVSGFSGKVLYGTYDSFNAVAQTDLNISVLDINNSPIIKMLTTNSISQNAATDNYTAAKIKINNNEQEIPAMKSIEQSEFIEVSLDKNDKFGYGLRNDGTFVANNIECPNINSNKEKSWLYGKKWIALGDSITNGGNYTNPLANMYDMDLLNLSIGGARWQNYNDGSTKVDFSESLVADSPSNVIMNQVYRLLRRATPSNEVVPEIDENTEFADGYSYPVYGVGHFKRKDVNLITIAAGVNDRGSQGALGDILESSPIAYTDIDKKTLVGAMKWACTVLMKYFPFANIVILAPIQAGDGTDANRQKLYQIVQKEIEFGGYYGFPVMNMHQIVPINHDIDTPTSHRYLTDGLHPTIDGGILMAKSIASYLESILHYSYRYTETLWNYNY